jgi:hypothetical protein
MRINFGEVIDYQGFGKALCRDGHPPRNCFGGSRERHARPQGRNFYEVEGGSIVYYIDVSPVTGAISLIATSKNMAQLMSQLDWCDVYQDFASAKS